MSPTTRQHSARFPAYSVQFAPRRLLAWMAFWVVAYFIALATLNALLESLLPVGHPGNGLDLVIGPTCPTSEEHSL